MADAAEDRNPATAMYRHRTETLSEERGEGPAVVFSHGTLMDRTMFRPQLDALSDTYRTVAYDHRSRTEHGRDPFDLDDCVADCRTLLDAKGIDTCVLAGMSMGGFMALRFALRYPDRLDGLVLVDSMASPHDEAEREQYGTMVEQTRAQGAVPEHLADAVAQMLFGRTTIEERPALVDRWTDRWRTYSGEAVYHEVRSWLHRPGVLDRVGEIDVPALVVHGEEDASLDLERVEPTVEALPDARLELVPGAGHSSNLENPGAVNDALRTFLDEVY